EDGSIAFDATHNKVTGGSATEATDSSNAVSLTLTDADGNNIPAIALKNTYTTGVTYDTANKKATFSRNDGNSYELSLKDMGATDYRLIGDGATHDQAYTMSADGTVTLNVQDQMNPDNIGQVTINGLVKQSDVAAAKTEVKAGTNVSVATDTTTAADGHTIYTVSADNLSYKANGTGAKNVKLADGLNFVDGTNTSAVVSDEGVVTFNTDNLTYQVGTNAAKNVELKTGLHFVDGVNTTAVQKEDGSIAFDATHNKVTGGSATEATDSSNAVSLTLTDADGNDIPAIALKNTYTTGVTYDTANKKATFSRNDGNSYELSLKEMGATDYRLVGDGANLDQAYKVKDDGTLTLNVKDQINGTIETVTIQDLVTKDDVAKKIKFKDGSNHSFEAGLGDEVTVKGINGIVTDAQDTNTYTIGINGADAAKEIPLSYKANGTNGQTVTLDKGLDFTNGTNTTAEVAADGVVKINVSDEAIQTAAAATDKYVRSGVATYGTDGKAAEGTATLTIADDSGNTTTATVTGLKNTYTTVTKDAATKTVTFSRNDGEIQTVSLSDLGGSSTDYAIEEQSVVVDADGKVTLKATDRMNSDNTYNVEITGVATKDDVAKKITFKDGSNHSFEAGLGDEVTVKGINGIVTDAQDTNTYTIGIDGETAAAEIPLSYKA
ncbi:MAG: hypothetical protein IKN59_05095, partial [Paludibacteraceae bacterium]|nr:hypothetical protein [Paludibacteraceae bacterium]